MVVNVSTSEWNDSCNNAVISKKHKILFLVSSALGSQLSPAILHPNVDFSKTGIGPQFTCHYLCLGTTVACFGGEIR